MRSRLRVAELYPIHNEQNTPFTIVMFALSASKTQNQYGGDQFVNERTNQSGCMRIRIHYRDQHAGPWTTAIRDVHQVPRVGEFLAPAPITVFRVVLSLHVLFEADYDAEVFAEAVDFYEVQCEALGEEVWPR